MPFFNSPQLFKSGSSQCLSFVTLVLAASLTGCSGNSSPTAFSPTDNASAPAAVTTGSEPVISPELVRSVVASNSVQFSATGTNPESSNPLSASVVFDLKANPGQLTVTLTNLEGASVPSDVLTAVFWDYNGTAAMTKLTLTSAVAAKVIGSTPGNSVDLKALGEWKLPNTGDGTASLPGVSQKYGIGTAGLGIFKGGGQQFNYAIISEKNTNANPAVNTGTFVQNSATFVLSGLPDNVDITKFGNVRFQYGTGLSEPSTFPAAPTPVPPTPKPSPTPTAAPTPAPPTPKPSPTPTATPTPAPTNTPKPCTFNNASSTAEADLRGSVDPKTGLATLTNNSSTCSYPVGLASYQMVDATIDNQILFDSTLVTIPPKQTISLAVTIPACAFQIDLFYGDLIPSFRVNGKSIRYGDRLINATNNGTQTNKSPYKMAFCVRPTPTPTLAPTPTPTVPPAINACVTNALGIADDFNVLMLRDMTQSNSDAEGQVAVGRNATLTNFSVGEKLTPSQGRRDDLIVGNTVRYNHGTLFTGNATYKNQGTFNNVTFLSGSARKASPLNFASLQTNLDSLSTYWGSLAATGTTTFEYGQLTLRGTKADYNVFTVKGSDLGTANTLTIQVPTGSTALVNVSGTVSQMKNMGISIQGTDRRNVLYNFYQATSLTVEGIGVEGSILADTAAISFNNGVINGNLIGRDLMGNGQSNYQLFNGCLPTR